MGEWRGGGSRKNGEGGQRSGTEEEKKEKHGGRRKRLEEKEEEKRTKHPVAVTPPMGELTHLETAEPSMGRAEDIPLNTFSGDGTWLGFGKERDSNL